MNEQGYRNLTELISKGYGQGQSEGIIIVERDWVKASAQA